MLRRQAVQLRRRPRARASSSPSPSDSDSTWWYLGGITAVYACTLIALALAMGIIGAVFALGVAAFELRAILFMTDERVELRGDVLVAHHHGSIRAFRRSDLAAINMVDYAAAVTGSVPLGPIGTGGVVAVLRLVTVDGEDLEIWQCPSREDRRAALRQALAVLDQWWTEPVTGPAAGRGEPPSPFHRAPD